MKIKSLELFTVAPRWLFLKITTESGMAGWGEPVVEGRADTVRAAVEELSEYVIGKDARRIEDIWQVLYRGGFYRGGPVLMSAISGIDQALWDIKGKALGVPVYDLLGGAVREKIRVYAWIGGDRPDDVAKEALAKKAEGYTAIKMNGTEEVEWIGSPKKITEAVARAAAIRDACGPEFGIAIDFHGRVHKGMAKVLMKELEGVRPAFHRGTGAGGKQRGAPRSALCFLRSHRHGRTPIHPLGLQATARHRRRGHHSAGLLAHRRDQRIEENRSHGGSV